MSAGSPAGPGVRRAAAVAVGDGIGPVERTATHLTLFLFGVAHWTAHRTHYDADHARSEGLPDVIVTAQLMSAWQIDLVSAWAGSPRALVSMVERNVSPAFAGDVLTVDGEVVAVDHDADGATVTCSTHVHIGDRAVVDGTFVVRLPS